jgi:hypothetical protein
MPGPSIRIRTRMRMVPCAARSDRTLFNNQNVQGLSPLHHIARWILRIAQHAGALNARRCVYEVEGESPGAGEYVS